RVIGQRMEYKEPSVKVCPASAFARKGKRSNAKHDAGRPMTPTTAPGRADDAPAEQIGAIPRARSWSTHDVRSLLLLFSSSHVIPSQRCCALDCLVGRIGGTASPGCRIVPPDAVDQPPLPGGAAHFLLPRLRLRADRLPGFGTGAPRRITRLGNPIP